MQGWKRLVVSVCLFLLVLGTAGPVLAGEKASAEDVYNLVLAAASTLEQLGENGLVAFNSDGEFSVKDTYVWVINCEAQRIVAHPNNKLIGLDITKIIDKNTDESKRKALVMELCQCVKNPNGLWTEYWWEKLGAPEPSRKIAFTLQVPNQPYQVSAGIYDDILTVAELNGTR